MKGYNSNKLKLIIYKPELIFVIIASVYGLAFLFITPPFQVPDENSHFIKAAGLSDGYWISEKIGDKAGITVSNNIVQFISEYPHSIVTTLNSDQDINGNQFVDLSNKSIVTYSPVSYALPAVVIKIGESLTLPAWMLLYLARLVNLFVWLFLTYLAIKTIPIQKWVLLLIALMPMTVFEAASVSIDSLTIALSFLAIAYILKLSFDDKTIKKIDFIALLVLGCLIALSKSIYIILFLLLVLIPPSKFKTHKMKYIFILTLLILISFVAIAWLNLTNCLYSPDITHWSISGQIQFIINNPSFYAGTILNNTIIQSPFYLMSFIGYFGWLEIRLSPVIVIFYMSLILIVALLDKNKIKISLNHKLIGLLVVLINTIAIFSFEYLTWNSIGTNFIEGVQGRYLIPISPVFGLLFYNNVQLIKYYKKKYLFKLNNVHKLIIPVIIVVTAFLSVLLTYSYYY